MQKIRYGTYALPRFYVLFPTHQKNTESGRYVAYTLQLPIENFTARIDVSTRIRPVTDRICKTNVEKARITYWLWTYYGTATFILLVSSRSH